MRVHIISLVLLLSAVNAKAFSVSDYLAQTQSFKEGYVLGVLESEALVQGADSESENRRAAILRCVQENNIHSQEVARIVGRYIFNTPEATASPMVGVVMNAILQTFSAYVK